MSHRTLHALSIAADTFEFVYDVGCVFVQHAIALAAITYVAGEFTGRWYRRTKARLQAWHAEWIGTDWQFTAPPVYIAPAINPLFDAQAALESAYSVRTFTKEFGVRKARTKYQQIGGYLAC